MMTSAGSCKTGEIEGVGAVKLVCVGRLLRTSAGSCKTGEIEGVGAVKLVCVGRLLRMDGKSLLLPA